MITCCCFRHCGKLEDQRKEFAARQAEEAARRREHERQKAIKRERDEYEAKGKREAKELLERLRRLNEIESYIKDEQTRSASCSGKKKGTPLAFKTPTKCSRTFARKRQRP